MNEQFDEIKTIINSGLSDTVQPEDQLVMAVARRVAELMETNMELFFNHLYRMDVDENKVHKILNTDTGETVYVAIAKIIVERQKKRLETKRKYKQEKIEDWDEY